MGEYAQYQGQRIKIGTCEIVRAPWKDDDEDLRSRDWRGELRAEVS